MSSSYGRIFERIIATVHHQVSGDDISSYNTDFSGMLIPRDPQKITEYREIASSLMSLLEKDKVAVFVMFYETLAFCARFRTGVAVDVNVRMIAEGLKELPQSTGEPHYIIGSNEATRGMCWNQVDVDDEGLSCEIFPLVDFESVCFYYAKPKEEHQLLQNLSSSSTSSLRFSNPR